MSTYTQHYEDGCRIVFTDEAPEDYNAEEAVEYAHYIIGDNVPKRGYITFHDDSGAETTYSTDDIDDLIDALNEIKALHARRIK